MIEVTLSQQQLTEVQTWAHERQRLTTARGKRDRYGYRGNGVEAHRIGLAAEYAVAIAFDLVDVWTPVVEEYEKLAADVGPYLHVRGTKHGRGSLIIHPRDPDRYPYVLVLYPNPPTFYVRGWIWGEDGKQSRWWQDPQGNRPAYFVPQSALEDIEVLRDAVEAAA